MERIVVAKRMKRSIEEPVEEDRLSDLPEPLILHILSLMETRYAAQTTVLAKRWLNLWTQLSVIKLNSEPFGSMESFKTFVGKVLTLRDSSIDISYLSFHSESALRRWYHEGGDRHNIRMYLSHYFRSIIDAIFVQKTVIENAVSHGVQSLCISVGEQLSFPSSVFDYENLKSLCLTNCFPIHENLTVSWNLKYLKNLHLTEVNFSHGSGFSDPIYVDLFSSCLNLENLFFKKCNVRSCGVFYISAPKLKSLTINHLVHKWFGKQCIVEVHAPQLTSLSYEGYCPTLITKDQCPMLEEVYVAVSRNRIWREMPSLVGDLEEQYFVGWNDMLGALSFVKNKKFDWNFF